MSARQICVYYLMCQEYAEGRLFDRFFMAGFLADMCVIDPELRYARPCEGEDWPITEFAAFDRIQ
jgi:hypothetical protein